MAEPELVAACVAAMGEAVRIPVTVKTRIGIDERDTYGHLVQFVDRVAAAGCRTFILHARKAWLKGLSPKENREIPPLRYETVYALKRDFPGLEIIINGGIAGLDQAEAHLRAVDGVMLGRSAYHNPYVLAPVDQRFFGAADPPPSRHQIMAAFMPYVASQRARGVPLKAMTRHVLGLFQGQPGARAWRRHLSENAHGAGAGEEVIEAALGTMARSVPRRTPDPAAVAS
jgi:tRNA-dihydrouridine synthase A